MPKIIACALFALLIGAAGPCHPAFAQAGAPLRLQSRNAPPSASGGGVPGGDLPCGPFPGGVAPGGIVRGGSVPGGAVQGAAAAHGVTCEEFGPGAAFSQAVSGTVPAAPSPAAPARARVAPTEKAAFGFL
ncbi:MAG: hypothetical protein LBQ12_01190, partial [Deltaproteobacteria bacterium]|nr:hypothetical protein [Deltaproteobacteria bacterium]